jgi:hypothetical protein
MTQHNDFLPAAIEIQPTILYLSTCILGESRPNNSLRSAVLQCFKKMATHRLNSNPLWEKYLLSTLAKLLDLAKTGMFSKFLRMHLKVPLAQLFVSGGDENNYLGLSCRFHLLSAIAIFIKESPPHLIRIPEVLYPAINLYQQAIRNTSDEESVSKSSSSYNHNLF